VPIFPQGGVVARLAGMLDADDGAAAAKALHAAAGRPCAETPSATIGGAMADQSPAQPLDQPLPEIGAQLAWVRDYL
jgi:hypothetical protein